MQPLLVLRGVVLEVLGEVAVRARGRDRLDDRPPLRPFELVELGLQRRMRSRGQDLAVVGHAAQWPQPQEPPQQPPPPPPLATLAVPWTAKEENCFETFVAAQSGQ